MQSVRQSPVNNRSRGWDLPVLPVAGFMMALLGGPAFGHGYMTYPQPRAVDHLKGDLKGWPIAGIKAKFRREPCMGLKQNRKFTAISPGRLTLKFLYPDGANHTGFCYAYLFDPMKPGDKVQIGEMKNCARSDLKGVGKKGNDITGHMDVEIPRQIPCEPSHCVLQWVWVATHISATNSERYEHYDNCADVKIIGGELRNSGEPVIPSVVEDEGLNPNVILAQGVVRRLIAQARIDGGETDQIRIDATWQEIAQLRQNGSHPESPATGGKTENRQGIEYLRDTKTEEAIHSFAAAYRLNPTDPEIVNNLGFAYLRGGDLFAAESLLLQALVFEPARTNAWANLGEVYARQSREADAVACFAFAYRFSEDRRVTLRFLQALAQDRDSFISQAARRTLALKLLSGTN